MITWEVLLFNNSETSKNMLGFVNSALEVVKCREHFISEMVDKIEINTFYDKNKTLFKKNLELIKMAYSYEMIAFNSDLYLNRNLNSLVSNDVYLIEALFIKDFFLFFQKGKFSSIAELITFVLGSENINLVDTFFLHTI